MALTNAQIQQLITLLTPTFPDIATRQHILFMAFPNDPQKPGMFNVDQAGQSFAAEVVRKLYSNNRADLLVLLQVIQEYMGGDLSRNLQPFVENLSRSTTATYPTTPTTRKRRLKIFVSYWHDRVIRLGDFIKLVLRYLSPYARFLALVCLVVLVVIIISLAGWGSGSSPLVTPTDTTVPPSPNAIASAATLIPAGTSNGVWTSVERDFDGVSMVLVPAGCFMMGSENGDSDEKPVHEVCFDQPFWIDRTEVTQAQFRQLGSKAAHDSSFTGDSRPVEQITWFEARDFCAVRGARLPTEAEWEYAARGPKGLIYPWGNEFVADNVVYEGNSAAETAPVGNRPSGVSWVGALDMSGNVWEWVSSLYQPYPYKADDGRESTGNTNSRVLRGGGWNNTGSSLRAVYRNWFTPDDWSVSLGFRCARSFDSETLPTVPTSTPAAVAPTPIPVGTSNTVWTPVTQNFDGVTMVLVPAGCFMMGSENGEDDEKPAHEICFEEPFWIDRTEITQGKFKQLEGRTAYSSAFAGDERPVEQITWFEARDFCALRGAHLPTEAEWEYAARGPEGVIYPWGNTFNASNVVYSGNSNSQTANVGSRTGGESWAGMLDVSGNVWEWTSSLYKSYPYQANDEREAETGTDFRRVLRGGSWREYESNVRATKRNRGTPDGWNGDVGFRCARDYW